YGNGTKSLCNRSGGDDDIAGGQQFVEVFGGTSSGNGRPLTDEQSSRVATNDRFPLSAGAVSSAGSEKLEPTARESLRCVSRSPGRSGDIDLGRSKRFVSGRMVC